MKTMKNDWKVAIVATALLAACGGSDDDFPPDPGPDTTSDATGDVSAPDVTDPDAVSPDVEEPEADVAEPDVVPDTTMDVAPDVEPDIDETDVTDATDGSAEPDVVEPPPEPSSCVETTAAFGGEDRRQVSLDGEGRVIVRRDDFSFGGYDLVESTYDADGRVLTRAFGYSSGSADGYESLTTYTYTEAAPSLAASFVEEQDGDGDGTPEVIVTGTQDALGRILTQEYRDIEGTLTLENRYTYASDDPNALPVGEYQDADGNGVPDSQAVPTIEGGLVVSILRSNGEVDPVEQLTTYTYDESGRRILEEVDDGADGTIDSRVETTWLSDDEYSEQQFIGELAVPDFVYRVAYAPGTRSLVFEQTLIPDTCTYTQYEFDVEPVFQTAYEGGTFVAASPSECVDIALADEATPTEFTRIEYGPFGPVSSVADTDGNGEFESIEITTYLDEGYIERRVLTTGEGGGATPVDTIISEVTRDGEGRLLTYQQFDDGGDLASFELVLTYNDAGLVATRSETSRFADSEQTYTYAYTYDEEGRVTGVVGTNPFDDSESVSTTVYEGPFPFDTCRTSEDFSEDR